MPRLRCIFPRIPSVGHNFLKGRKVTFTCSYRSTFFYRPSTQVFLKLIYQEKTDGQENTTTNTVNATAIQINSPQQLNRVELASPQHLNRVELASPQHLNRVELASPQHLNRVELASPQHLNRVELASPQHLNRVELASPQNLNRVELATPQGPIRIVHSR